MRVGVVAGILGYGKSVILVGLIIVVGCFFIV